MLREKTLAGMVAFRASAVHAGLLLAGCAAYSQWAGGPSRYAAAVYAVASASLAPALAGARPVLGPLPLGWGQPVARKVAA